MFSFYLFFFRRSRITLNFNKTVLWVIKQLEIADTIEDLWQETWLAEDYTIMYMNTPLAQVIGQCRDRERGLDKQVLLMYVFIS